MEQPLRSMALLAPALALAVAAPAPAAWAAPDEDPLSQAMIASRFAPFDKVAAEGWEDAFPTPIFRVAGPGDADAVTFQLKAGAYMIVTLCNCAKMDITLLGPGDVTLPPIRHNDQGSMYSLDVPEDGPYLIGVDMVACAQSPCSYAVKTYHKKK